jgi:hypothetical protein
VFYVAVGDDQCRFTVQSAWEHVVDTPEVALDYINYCEVVPTKPSSKKAEIDFILRTNFNGQIHNVGFLNNLSHKITARTIPAAVEKILEEVRAQLKAVVLENVTEPLTEVETAEHGTDFIAQQKAAAKPKAKKAAAKPKAKKAA